MNRVTLKYVRVSFHTDLHITIIFRFTLLPPTSQFRQAHTWSCKQITSKTLNFTKKAVKICTAARPHFNLLPVPETRKNSSFSFYWERKTNGNFVLCNLGTWYRWVVRLMCWPYFPLGRRLVHTNQGAEWASEPFWRRKKTFALAGIRNLGFSSSQPPP